MEMAREDVEWRVDCSASTWSVWWAPLVREVMAYCCQYSLVTILTRWVQLVVDRRGRDSIQNEMASCWLQVSRLCLWWEVKLVRWLAYSLCLARWLQGRAEALRDFLQSKREVRYYNAFYVSHQITSNHLKRRDRWRTRLHLSLIRLHTLWWRQRRRNGHHLWQQITLRRFIHTQIIRDCIVYIDVSLGCSSGGGGRGELRRCSFLFDRREEMFELQTCRLLRFRYSWCCCCWLTFVIDRKRCLSLVRFVIFFRWLCLAALFDSQVIWCFRITASVNVSLIIWNEYAWDGNFFVAWWRRRVWDARASEKLWALTDSRADLVIIEILEMCQRGTSKVQLVRWGERERREKNDIKNEKWHNFVVGN